MQHFSDHTGAGPIDALRRNENGQLALSETNLDHVVSNHVVGCASRQAASIGNSWSVLHHQSGPG